MKHFPWKETGWAVAFVALLLLLYVVSYCVLVSRDVVNDPKDGTALLVPTYQTGGEFSGALFAPAQQLDQRLRPEFWSVQGYFRSLPKTPLAKPPDE